MIDLSVPGMVFFALTWEYADFDGCHRWEKSKGKWFRQVLPVGSQIDLLRKEIPRYCKNHACKSGQIRSITLSSTGFHFTDEFGEGDFVRPIGFTPAFPHNVDWHDIFTIKLSRCILATEKVARSHQFSVCTEPPNSPATVVLPTP